MINQAVHEKYRSSKLGRVPSDWQDVKFADMFDERREFTNDTEKYPLYSLTIEEGVTPKTERYERSYLIKKIEDNFKIVRKDDFVYNPMNLRFGSIARHKEENEVCVSGYYNVFKIKNGYSPVFIEHYLKSERMMYLYNSIATGSLKEKQRVHFSQFLELELPMPSVKESEKIADILSTWDKAIELKEKLIEQKKEQKKGLMQRLLTGKVRLPGFKGEWKEVKLGDIIKECKEQTTKNNEYPVLTSSRKGLFLQEVYFSKQVASDDNTGYKIVRKGDFTYRTMSDDGDFVFNQLENYEIGIVSPAYAVFRPTRVNSIYLRNLLNSYTFKKYIKKVVQGGTRLSFRFNDLKEIKVLIPSLEEQNAIGDILLKAEEQIALMEQELFELKQQKKGLMQLLLTGKVRVKC